MPEGLSWSTQARWGTRLSFFTGGFAVAAWAPLIPTIKQSLGLESGLFGLVLLCLGLGSMVSMPATGMIIARVGARRVISAASIVATVMLPGLALAPDAWTLAACLAIFGAALGALDVAMNVHGAEVERRERRPLMSGFHATFSVGMFVGAMLSSSLIWLGVAAPWVAATCGLVGFGASRLALPGIRDTRSEHGVGACLPRGPVLLIAGMVTVIFLVEGAVLDWGALLLVERRLMDQHAAGVGFVMFSIGMVLMRFVGDAVVLRAGSFSVIVGSGLVTMLGMVLILSAQGPIGAQWGFFLVGAGAACVAPTLISAAGKQDGMPPEQAIASVTTAGYAGHLFGPAVVGVVTQVTDLSFAFGLLVFLIATIPLGALFLREKI